MQNTQTSIGIEAMLEASGNGVNNFKQESTNANEFNNENPNHFNSFTSPSNSSSSTFHNPQVGAPDKISSVVTMLKGTLERKKLVSQVDKGDSSFGYYNATEILGNGCLNQGQEIHAFEIQGTFEDVSRLGVEETRVLQTIEESLMEGIMGPLTISEEPSQSESSAAVVSNGFDMCDDPCFSAQAPSVCESSRNQLGSRRSPEDCSGSKGTDK